VKIWIPYPEDNVFADIAGTPPGEWVEAQPSPLHADAAVLTQFASGVSLVPGDVVTIEDGALTGIQELAPVWVFEVYANTPNLIKAPGLHDPSNWDLDGLDDNNWQAAQIAADEMVAHFARATAVERTTNFTIRLATESRVWFDQLVAVHPHVDFYSVIREPGELIDLDQELHSRGEGVRPMFDKHGARIS